MVTREGAAATESLRNQFVKGAETALRAQFVIAGMQGVPPLSVTDEKAPA
jgi:hypothetical protein